MDGHKHRKGASKNRNGRNKYEKGHGLYSEGGRITPKFKRGFGGKQKDTHSPVTLSDVWPED